MIGTATEEEEEEEEADSAISSFTKNNSRISMGPAGGRIAYPVVIPQRRT
jgi:hypothetical protein